MKKKLLLTSLVICIGILVFGVINASAETEGYFTYTVSNGEATITSCDKSASGIVTIPDTLGGYPVTTIGYNPFYDCDNITGLVFGKNVKSIGSYTTLGCDNIASISMTDSVTSIGQYAFGNLDKLEFIILSKNITSMGNGVLQNCNNLRWVVLPDKITALVPDTFSYCTNLQKVFIPKTVTSISYYVFQQCNSLTDVYFGGSQTQWNNISITTDNTSLSSLKTASIHYNTPARYTINYNANGGSNAPVTQTKIYDISTYLSSVKPTKYGYTFSKWNTRADGTGTSYNSGATYSANASATLYAQWIPNQYTVNYYSNDEKNLLLATSYHTYGVTRTLYKNTYSRAGYRFSGWGISKNSTAPKYMDEESVLNLSTNNGAVINLYAIWEIETYTVTYDANGGENAPASHSARAFTDTNLSSDIPRRDGYVFEGWAEDATAETAQHQPGDTISVGSADITLYAVWRKYIVIASGNCDFNLTWNLYEDGTLVISGIGEMTWINYSSAPWREYRNSVKRVIIEEGVTSIASYAFSDCTNLTDIDIAKSVTSIGDGAFGNCTALTHIDISENVTSIGKYVFGYCDSLNSILVNGNNAYYSSDERGVLYNKDKTILIQYPAGNTAISYVVPESVISIGDCAYRNCTNLSSIDIAENITSIGYAAFENCSALTVLDIPERVISIGRFAFSGCAGLTEMYIPDGVTNIGNSTFYNCVGLTSINIPDNVTIIEGQAFQKCTKLSNITFGENSKLTSIGSNAFSGCNSLIDIDIPESVVSIESCAFYNCKSIQSVGISKSVLSIGNWAFGYCDNLTDISFAEDSALTSIGEYAFSDCLKLTSMNVSKSVTDIGEYAFRNCTNLTNIIFEEESKLTSIGKYAFHSCKNLEATYYHGNKEQWNNISIGSNNDPLINNVIFVKYTKTTISEDGKTYVVNPVNVDEGVTVIVALYKDDIFVEIQSAIYKSVALTFTATKDYDTVKIMVWEDLYTLEPITEPEII
ncbi:MAG: leucine-rich repeat protein [Clostridia bacterium]|nr:leucine-rich repeat protein [Clostridia bacterium]